MNIEITLKRLPNGNFAVISPRGYTSEISTLERALEIVREWMLEYAEEENYCRVCNAPIVIAELCAACAKTNDPFFQSKYR